MNQECTLFVIFVDPNQPCVSVTTIDYLKMSACGALHHHQKELSGSSE